MLVLAYRGSDTNWLVYEALWGVIVFVLYILLAGLCKLVSDRALLRVYMFAYGPLGLFKAWCSTAGLLKGPGGVGGAIELDWMVPNWDEERTIGWLIWTKDGFIGCGTWE